NQNGVCLEPWPNGLDGDLLVTTGQTLDLAVAFPGKKVFNFNSITVQNGGTLVLPVVGREFIALGSKGNVVIDGTINGVQKITAAGGAASITLPNGFVVSTTLTQSA